MATWTKIPKAFEDTTGSTTGSPIGLLLLWTYSTTSIVHHWVRVSKATGSWTKITKAAAGTWIKITKAT